MKKCVAITNPESYASCKNKVKYTFQFIEEEKEETYYVCKYHLKRKMAYFCVFSGFVFYGKPEGIEKARLIK